MMKWKLYSDGASRGNPGQAGAGVLLLNDKGDEIPLTRYLGVLTNNQAEYEALLLGLEKLREFTVESLEIYADSELMVRQLLGQYKVKNEKLWPLFKRAKELLSTFKRVSISHVLREDNKKADQLANEAIDHHEDLK